MNRKAQQADLVFQLGALLGPLFGLAADPARYDSEERERIRARFFNECETFCAKMSEFAAGEKGHRYAVQADAVWGDIHVIGSSIKNTNWMQWLSENARQYRDKIVSLILSIPVPVESAIHEAHSTFSTYCFVKNLCSTVGTQIVWLDRYFDQTVFHRFLTETPANISITLITLPSANLKGKADQQRYSEFMDISRLFAQQRGLLGYRLIENPDFHDRWLRCDDRLFALGGSIKQLDQPFTISKIDFAPGNVKHFDDALNQGTELFGPNHLNHP